MILDEMFEILKEIVGDLGTLFADQSYSFEDICVLSDIAREGCREEIDHMLRMHIDGTSFTEKELAYMYGYEFFRSLLDEYRIQMELCGRTTTEGFSIEDKYVTFAICFARDRVALLVDSVNRCC